MFYMILPNQKSSLHNQNQRDMDYIPNLRYNFLMGKYYMIFYLSSKHIHQHIQNKFINLYKISNFEYNSEIFLQNQIVSTSQHSINQPMKIVKGSSFNSHLKLNKLYINYLLLLNMVSINYFKNNTLLFIVHLSRQNQVDIIHLDSQKRIASLIKPFHLGNQLLLYQQEIMEAIYIILDKYLSIHLQDLLKRIHQKLLGFHSPQHLLLKLGLMTQNKSQFVGQQHLYPNQMQSN
ncbi:hypothetical protein TTHERM_000009878 (macronuclear) [Tetrahymena thermophila SB210]|uniref:Uncharacterized protein n=1 Tax=Tetrahymena thermophila (strain SB210) TaxID=312017 RepID=W7XKA1_TETTS|nr:hypothetical protein TTHERM_000009878 [Tetrahymena thermophila SB210]EWS76321.1 hypothetical protein TTHERM_000009878 [Tetrahymena thermophila SB210]|eukprot:XP_012651105.1 hypothetical protein TTHERM_000009878 [Tetrahymena thermophila SB210]